MSKESIRITVPFTLEVITPVFIGSGQGLNVLEYILDTANHDVYILNQKKWFQYLGSIDKLAAYEEFIKQYVLGKTKLTNFEWLERTISIPDERMLMSVSTRHLKCVKNAIFKRTLNKVALGASLIDGSPFIPGSSLKGVIISSLIAHLIDKNKVFKYEWRHKLIQAQSNPKYLKKCISDYGKAIEKLIGNNYKGASNKLFHNISISDVMPVTRTNTWLLPRFDSIAGRGGKNKLSIYKECIVPQTKLSGTLGVNIKELQTVGIDSISELMRIVEVHTQRLLTRWKSSFKENIEQSCIYELETCTCLLGGSVGFLHKTLLLPLFDNQREEVEVVKSILGKKHMYDKIISPRTLKLTKYRGKDYIFGGVKLHFEND
jgi:CRISPR-associated RAMP protein, csm5 family